MNDDFYNETLKMIEEERLSVGNLVANEAIRLLNCGAIDRNYHNRSTLFKVAFENVADTFYKANIREYNNLRKF